MTKEEKKRHCKGCRNDFYNGDNPYGIQDCWSLEGAELVYKKEVHINQRPPWNQNAIQVLDCYRKPQHVYVDPDKTC